MRPISHKSIAWVLIAAVVAMLGATTGVAFAHEIQHAAHHSAGMHSSGICAWMCATAGTLSTTVLQPVHYDVVRPTELFFTPTLISRDDNPAPLPRAPPIL